MPLPIRLTEAPESAEPYSSFAADAGKSAVRRGAACGGFHAGAEHNGSVPASAYDDVPYPTFPRIETHPDRLAAVATLFGMTPAPVRNCRVLEIGCGDG